MRAAICTLRESGRELGTIELQAIAAYKYCTVVSIRTQYIHSIVPQILSRSLSYSSQMQHRFRGLLTKLTDELSLRNSEKRNFLLDPLNEADNGTTCYTEASAVFYSKCVGEFVRTFKSLEASMLLS